MNKILTKTVKKVTIWSAILAVILVAGIVLGAIFGFNKSLTVKDYSTVIVKMDKAEPVKEATLKEICDAAINTVAELRVKVKKLSSFTCSTATGRCRQKSKPYRRQSTRK